MTVPSPLVDSAVIPLLDSAAVDDCAFSTPCSRRRRRLRLLIDSTATLFFAPCILGVSLHNRISTRHSSFELIFVTIFIVLHRPSLPSVLTCILPPLFFSRFMHCAPVAGDSLLPLLSMAFDWELLDCSEQHPEGQFGSTYVHFKNYARIDIELPTTTTKPNLLLNFLND